MEFLSYTQLCTNAHNVEYFRNCYNFVFFLPVGSFDPKSKDYDKITMMRAMFGVLIVALFDENCTC